MTIPQNVSRASLIGMLQNVKWRRSENTTEKTRWTSSSKYRFREEWVVTNNRITPHLRPPPPLAAKKE